jgi:hypothetical protein
MIHCEYCGQRLTVTNRRLVAAATLTPLCPDPSSPFGRHAVL